MSDLTAALAPLDGCPFWAMDGLGNDFVIVDLRKGGEVTSQAAMVLGNREGPFGCDQIIGLINDSDGTPAMTVYNADGSLAETCGNAARCVAWLLMEETGKKKLSFGSPAGRLNATRECETEITVDMGEPKLDWPDIPLAEEMNDTRFIDIKLGPIDNPVLWGPSACSMGNPHCIFFVDDIDAHALDRFGPMIEHHPIFPERANVSIAQVISSTSIRIRTWERGVGLTDACGTAACATLVSSVRRRLTERKAEVESPGGIMTIEWDETTSHVLMTGPIKLQLQGVLSA